MGAIADATAGATVPATSAKLLVRAATTKPFCRSLIPTKQRRDQQMVAANDNISDGKWAT